MHRRRRALLFAVLAAVCVAGAAVTAATAVIGAQHARSTSAKAVAAARPQVERLLASGRPFAVLRDLDRRHPANYGRLAIAPLDADRPGRPVLAGPVCARVGYAGGRGLCLGTPSAANRFTVTELDGRLREIHHLDLVGAPSRARVSPDGRWGGVTAFVTGHSYASVGQFSTAATIIDMRTGKVVGNLEKDFKVFRDGTLVDAVDRNYWGLTFAADGDTFYATLATGGKTWLIKGSIRARRAHTIHENVECPSLSPDGTRIGYKKAVGHNPTVWRFHVLDLATGRETALAETRPIDDQLAWLDDRHLIYHVDETTWVVDADGAGKPHLWMPAADSVTVTRPSG